MIVKLAQKTEYTILAGLLIDGTGRPPQRNAAIRVKNGKISAIPPGLDPDPARQILIDCSHLTILPGLIDCHIHLALNGSGCSGTAGHRDDNLLETVTARLDGMLAAGIMAARDGGDRRLAGIKSVRRLNRTPANPPEIIATGRALRKKNSYGAFLGRGLSPEEVPSTVRELAGEGADQIKVLVSGIVSFREYGLVGNIQFNRSELEALVKESRRLGLKVMAHASSDEAVTLAVQAGVDSVEHGYFISKRSLAAMAEKDIAWVPTVIPVAVQTRFPLHKNYTVNELDLIIRIYRQHLLMIARGARMGVTIGAGTDAGATGVEHGNSYVEELKLLAEAGLPNAVIISTATLNGAKILGLAEKLGTVEPGKKAWLIGVRGNPLKNIGCLKNPAVVFYV